MPGARECRLRAGANGADYRLSLWLPPGTPPVGGWPVIFVLDANALFGTFVESIRRSSRRPDATGIGPAVVVGIAADDDDLYAPALRERDFTPAASGAEGGADAFLAFLVDELAPALRRELPLDGGRQILFGHSLAGYFTLHALLARSGAFHGYAAISPSIWWNEPHLRSRLPVLAGMEARVFVGVGEWEDELPPWQRGVGGHEKVIETRAQRRMIANARALAGELGAVLGEDKVLFRLFPDEDHASVLMIAVQRVLRFALRPVAADPESC
ncbi:MAG: hypothetical protein BSR46_01965 [Candidatus Dactylopiibacterium carminicum]|nr:MAG: hypothetical protein BSR46_01965 [Candidatus Dactylopiibacterium carminicum]